jgi:HptB-dependent secretion and biofilm anti anti-sigma factor
MIMPIVDMFNNTAAEIKLIDRFTFKDSHTFQQKLETLLEKGPRSLTIELSKLSFIDSAGLGMLVLTLNSCKNRNVILILSKPQGDVQTLLRLTKSYERFRIVS